MNTYIKSLVKSLPTAEDVVAQNRKDRVECARWIKANMGLRTKSNMEGLKNAYLHIHMNGEVLTKITEQFAYSKYKFFRDRYNEMIEWGWNKPQKNPFFDYCGQDDADETACDYMKAHTIHWYLIYRCVKGK